LSYGRSGQPVYMLGSGGPSAGARDLIAGWRCAWRRTAAGFRHLPADLERRPERARARMVTDGGRWVAWPTRLRLLMGPTSIGAASALAGLTATPRGVRIMRRVGREGGRAAVQGEGQS